MFSIQSMYTYVESVQINKCSIQERNPADTLFRKKDAYA